MNSAPFFLPINMTTIIRNNILITVYVFPTMYFLTEDKP